MHRLNLRRTLALAATPLLIAALTACGGDEQSADEPAAASASEESSPAEEESTPAEEESADDTAPGEPVDKEQFLTDFRAAVEDATTARMSMTTEAAGSNFTADGEVDYTTSPPSMAMMMSNPTMGEQTMDIRLVDGFFYLNLGQMSQNKFVKVDVTDKNSPLGDISQLTSAMDPVQAFEKFAAGLDEVTLVGEESVDGETLDHYLLTLDSSKVEMLQGAGTENLPATLEYDLWLDDEDRMRQVTIDMAGTGSVDMKIFAWDEPVDIEAPAANLITEMPGS
jgi:hypothetical protein